MLCSYHGEERDRKSLRRVAEMCMMNEIWNETQGTGQAASYSEGPHLCRDIAIHRTNVYSQAPQTKNRAHEMGRSQKKDKPQAATVEAGR